MVRVGEFLAAKTGKAQKLGESDFGRMRDRWQSDQRSRPGLRLLKGESPRMKTKFERVTKEGSGMACSSIWSGWMGFRSAFNVDGVVAR